MTPRSHAATGDAALKKAIADAQKAYTAGEAALKEQDWEAYGKAQKDLQEALERAAAAQPKAAAWLLRLLGFLGRVGLLGN